MSFKWGKATLKKSEDVKSTEITEIDEKWTKEELKVYNNAVYGICYSVVKQWIDDGKPMIDWYGVLPYINILKQMEA